MSTYNPAPVRLTPFVRPADGEDVDAASVNVPFEAVADGIEWASQQLDVLASFAALRALDTTSLANGTTRLVKGQGFYTLDTASALTEREPFVIDPTTGPGRWISTSAHETSLTRWVPAALALRGMPTAANAPSITSSWRPIPQSSSVVFGSGGFLVQVSSTHATNAWGFYFPINDWLIDGATLSSVTFRYEPANAGADPTVFPQIAVGRDGRGGTTSSIDQLYSGGFVIDSGGTYQTGTVRNLVYSPDQANVIDLSNRDYFIVIYDEHGTNAGSGNNFLGFSLAMTSIPDGRRS